MKGKILVSSILAILLIASVHSVNASTLVIDVDPPYLEVDVGEAFSINISVTNVEAPGLYGWELMLYYDNTLLNVTDAGYPSGHFLEGPYTFTVPPIIDRTEGTVLFSAIVLGDVPGRTGSGVLATVQFNGTGVGDAPLEIKDVELLDPEGHEPEYTVNDGVVKVIPEFTPALMIVIFMTITLAAIILRRLPASKKHNAYCTH